MLDENELWVNLFIEIRVCKDMQTNKLHGEKESFYVNRIVILSLPPL